MRIVLFSTVLACAMAFAQPVAARPQSGHGASSKEHGGPGGGGGPGDTVPSTHGARPSAEPTASGPVAGSPGQPAGAPAQPRGAATAREILAAQDPTSWDLWWVHNRDPYYALRTALDRIHPQSAGDVPMSHTSQRRAGVSWDQLYREVVPALLETLAGAQDARIVRGSLLSLARIGEAAPVLEETLAPAILPVLATYLDHEDRQIAETAVIALGVLGSRESLLHLAEIARDTSAGRKLCSSERVPLRTRALAAFGLGLCASYQNRAEVTHFAAWNLCEILRHDSLRHPDLRVACVIALGLTPLHQRGSTEVAAHEERPSRSRRDEVDFLLGIFADEREAALVRAHVPTALVRLLPGALPFERERVLHALLLALDPAQGEASEVRTGCMLALGLAVDCDSDLLDEQARSMLAAGMESHDVLERHFATLALGQALGRVGNAREGQLAGLSKGSAHLLNNLRDANHRLAPWVALSMGLLCHPLREQEQPVPAGFAQALALKFAATHVPEDAAAYAIAAGLIGDISLRTVLEAGLQRFRDEHWRAQIAIALGLLGDEEALPALRQVAQDCAMRPELFEATAVARALLGDRQLVPELIAQLPLAESWTEVHGVARALAWTADGQALEPILNLLASGKYTSAEEAYLIEALGWIGDKERVIWEAKLSVGLNYPAATQTLSDPWGLGILDTL